MAEYELTGPDGNTYSVTAPEGASEQDLVNYVKNNSSKALPSPRSDEFNPMIAGLGATGEQARQASGGQNLGPGIQAAQDIYNAAETPMRGLRGITTGIAQAVPAFRSGESSQLPDPQTALQRAAEATKPGFEPQGASEKTADIIAQAADPMNLFMGEALKAAGKAGKPLAEFGGEQLARALDTSSGVDATKITKLFKDPASIMKAGDVTETGKVLGKMKTLAGVTEQEERELALDVDKSKSFYQTTMNKIDNFLKNRRPGLSFLSTTGETAPEQSANVEVSIKALQKDKQGNIVTPYYGVKGEPDVLQHHFNDPAPASVTLKQLTDAGLEPPTLDQGVGATRTGMVSMPLDKNSPTVADLLKVKQAGWSISKANPGAKGVISKDIAEKVNPLLQEMAPKVYEAQQANHLAQVKKAFMQILPTSSSGKVSFWRALEAVGASHMAGPLGALPFSPLAVGAGTATAGMIAKGLGTKAGSQILGIGARTGLNRAFNTPEIQSLLDRLKNAKQDSQ